MDERQKKIIQRSWEVFLFLASLVVTIIGIIWTINPSIFGKDSNSGGVVMSIIGAVMLEPKTIIAMWIRQIMNRKHRDNINSDIKQVLEDSGIKPLEKKKQRSKTHKNEPKPIENKPVNPFCTLE